MINGPVNLEQREKARQERIQSAIAAVYYCIQWDYREASIERSHLLGIIAGLRELKERRPA